MFTTLTVGLSHEILTLFYRADDFLMPSH